MSVSIYAYTNLEGSEILHTFKAFKCEGTEASFVASLDKKVQKADKPEH